jgi:hypothetical protein
VEAIAAFGGLAVTPMWLQCNRFDSERCTVTHVGSGGALFTHLRPRQAIRLMAALCERVDADWTAPAEELRTMRLRDRAQRIYQEICG